MKCPDCNRENKTDITEGSKQCKKCLQYIIIKGAKPVKCVPKEIII